MLLAIFFPDFGAQKHGPCHHARTSLPGEEGRSAPHALCPLPALSAKQLSEIQNAIFRNSLRYCERQARGPAASCVNETGMTPARLISSRVGRMPTKLFGGGRRANRVHPAPACSG